MSSLSNAHDFGYEMLIDALTLCGSAFLFGMLTLDYVRYAELMKRATTTRHLRRFDLVFDSHSRVSDESALLWSSLTAARASRKGLDFRANKVLLGVTFVMFLTSTGYGVALFVGYVQQVLGLSFVQQGGAQGDEIYATMGSSFTLDIALFYLSFFNVCHPFLTDSTSKTYFYILQYISGDAIIVWRAWALWPDNRKVVMVPIGLLIGSTGEYLLAYPKAKPQRIASTVSSLVCGGLEIRAFHTQSLRIEKMGGNAQLASWALSLATSVVATLLIAYKAWFVSSSSRIV